MADMIKRYHALPWVEYAEPQYFMHLLDTGVSDQYANPPYSEHLKRIQAEKAWDITHDTNQIVAVIDSGLWVTINTQTRAITGGHPDLIGNDPSRPTGNIFSNLSNTNFITSENGPNNPFDTSGAWRTVDCGNVVPAGSNPCDENSGGHGTHVAGIIGALANNITQSVAGVAWKSESSHTAFLTFMNRSGVTATAPAPLTLTLQPQSIGLLETRRKSST